MKKITHAIVLTALLISPLHITAQEINRLQSSAAFPDQKLKALKARLADYARQFQLTGVAAAIVQGDQLLWSDGVGTANPLTKQALTADTPHLIASISKTVTAGTLLRLAEQGRLSLDTDIQTYLDFPVRNPNFPAVPITCRQLLSHRASISDTRQFATPVAELYTFGADPKESLSSFCRSYLTPTGSRYSADSFTSSQPGSAYEYSNLGLALAGLVAEKATKTPFATLSQALLFKPLGMKSTSWRLADFPQQATLAMPLTAEDVPYGQYTFPDYPNGGLRTSVNDFSRYLRTVMNGGSLGRNRIFQPATVRDMLQSRSDFSSDQAPLLGYSLGWFHFAFDGIHPDLIGHSGGEQGVNTLMAYNPATRTGAIVFAHEDYSPSGPQALSQAILLSDLMLAAENLKPLPVKQAIQVKQQLREVDCYLTALRKKGFSGQLHLSLNGRPIYSKGYGDADRAKNSPITPATRFAIGSITKTFTATAITVLADEGRLDLHQPMVRYLPGKPTDYPTAWQPITVRQLLHHTSGLGDFLEQGAAIGADPRQPIQPAQVIQLIRDVPLSQAPGSGFAYSNSGYYLLGMIIAQVSGTSYENYITHKILAPLGMHSTSFAFQPTAGQALHAIGYEGEIGTKPTTAVKFDRTVTYSAGALHSTAADLAIWAKAQRPAQFLSPEAWTLALADPTQITTEIAKDSLWFHSTLAARPYFWHDGGINGFDSILLHFPGQELTITLLQNSSLFRNQTPAFDPRTLATRIAKIMKP
jgi:CubicO group peptidase (beta-lactamase class C family)